MDSLQALKMETDLVLYSLPKSVVLEVTPQRAASMAFVLAFGQSFKAMLSPIFDVGSTDFLTHHLKLDIPLLGEYRYPDRHGH